MGTAGSTADGPGIAVPIMGGDVPDTAVVTGTVPDGWVQPERNMQAITTRKGRYPGYLILSFSFGKGIMLLPAAGYRNRTVQVAEVVGKTVQHWTGARFTGASARSERHTRGYAGEDGPDRLMLPVFFLGNQGFFLKYIPFSPRKKSTGTVRQSGKVC
jgi:hypothetical protein